MLTQLNKLDLLCCSKVNDYNLEEIIALTKLTHLGIGFIDQYTSKSVTKLSNLVNLEHLDIQQTTGMTSEDFKVLCQLPKLTRLDIEFGQEYLLGYFDPSISIIGQLSALTHLTVSMSYDSTMNVSLLTKLTNLESANFHWCNPTGDLSVFAKMTNLDFQYSDKVLALPANLQSLFMGSDIIDKDAMELIVNLTNLHTLQISAYSKLESNLGKFIKHLTHLTNIRFTPTVPKGNFMNILMKHHYSQIYHRHHSITLPSFKFGCVVLPKDSISYHFRPQKVDSITRIILLD